MRTAFVLGGLVLLAAACGKEINPNYCLAHPDDVDCPASDGGTACMSSAECAGATPVCDTTGSMTCVQCLPDQAQACTGTTPTCGDDLSCRGCAAHAECVVSNACLPDGACADEGDVAYVGGPGATDNEMCTKAAPCTKVTKALAKTRPFVLFAATTDEGATVVIDSQNVTLLARPGARLVRTSNGVILEIRGTSQVAIYDLEISGGGGPAGVGISLPLGNDATVSLARVTIEGNDGGGIAANGGSLAVSQSTISGNQGAGVSTNSGSLTISRSSISGNQGGGVSVTNNGQFDLTNNFIFRNGNQTTSSLGGILLSSGSAGTNRLEFNTIVDNVSAAGPGGVVCLAASFSAPNNVIARNRFDNNPTPQTSGACTYPSSRVQDDVAGLAFVDPEGPAPFDYRLAPGSSAIDQAVTSSLVDVDFDGDLRPQGSDKDIGADELMP